MKHFDENVTNELRNIRNEFINSRWSQLHSLSKESADSAIKYLFTINAGGAIAILAYLGSINENNIAPLSVKVSLILFFVGILFVGFYKAYIVHIHEGIFKYYQTLVEDYYKNNIGWNELTKSDENKVGQPLLPYVLSYISFICFIAGCTVGACGLF